MPSESYHVDASEDDDLALFEYNHASTLSEKALSIATSYQSPPYPKIYEVFFEYASGHNVGLNATLDETMGQNKKIPRATLEAIHQKFLDPFQDLRNMQTQTGQKLGQQIGELQTLIDLYISSNDTYRNQLEESSDSLENVSGVNELREKLAELIDQNQSMHEQTKNLTQCLETSKTQIDCLRSQLMDAVRDTMLDQLTGLGNRRWLDISLNEIVGTPKAAGEKNCIAMIDIDHFKRLNDNFGHMVGDKVLSFFGSLLSKTLRRSDVCTRFGGEEFCLILRGVGVDEANVLMEKIRSTLKNSRLVLSSSKVQIGSVTASFGVTQIHPDDTQEHLLERVDRLLYEAKRQGRDKVVSG